MLVSRDSAYQYLNKFVAVEITTTVRGIAEDVALGRAEGLAKRCVANCDNLRTIPRANLVRRAGAISPGRWVKVKRAVGHALAWTELIDR